MVFRFTGTQAKYNSVNIHTQTQNSHDRRNRGTFQRAVREDSDILSDYSFELESTQKRRHTAFVARTLLPEDNAHGQIPLQMNFASICNETVAVQMKMLT
jgi:hypothetical protein